MTDAELNLVGQAMGVSAPFIAVFLALRWDGRRQKRRRR